MLSIPEEKELLQRAINIYINYIMLSTELNYVKVIELNTWSNLEAFVKVELEKRSITSLLIQHHMTLKARDSNNRLKNDLAELVEQSKLLLSQVL